MDESLEIQMDGTKRRRLLDKVGALVDSGLVTSQEAERLRSATDQGEFDAVVLDIRVRHAGTSMGAAVEDGRLTRADAEGFLERLRQGEHSRSIRLPVRGLHSRHRSGSDGQLTAETGKGGQKDASE